VIPRICPRCAGKNFQWASKCDHCGLPLKDDQAAADSAPIWPTSDDGERIVDLEAHREQLFHASLAAATPHIFVTPVLIGLNVAIFLAMVARGISAVAPPPDALIRWGADYGPMTTHGQWWRLLTCAFVHIGIVHLLVNMVALLIIGRYTERLFGNGGFLALYVLGAVAASLTSLSIHPTIVSAGASGAISALYGGLIGFLFVRRSTMSYATATSLFTNAFVFIVFNLNLRLTKEHIDIAAHAGGLLAGVPIGSALAFRLATGTAAARLLRSAIVCVAGVAVMAQVARRLPVLDDWPREFARWVLLTQDTAIRANRLLDDGRSNRLTPAQLADRIEREVIPPLKAERAKLEGLRLLPDQNVVARKAVEYLSLEAEALQLAAAGERSGDSAAINRGIVKGDEAAEALQRVVPDPKLAAALAERKATRASIEALAAEIKQIGDLEKEQARLYNQTVKDVRSKMVKPEDLARVIEQKMLPPWKAERERLSGLRFVPSQEPYAKRLLEYMSLREEGWRLIATGLRSNDNGLIQQGNAKQKAAMKLMEAKAEDSLDPRSQGSGTVR
jgi:membrane associated rhomboid family serine protease